MKRHTIKKHVREYIIQRDKGRCRYCGKKPGERYVYTSFTSDDGYWRSRIVIDHITPHCKGGADHPANLVVACESCNLEKYDNTWTPLPVPP